MTSTLFQSLFDLEIVIEINQAHTRFIKLPYNTRRAIKFLNLNFLYILKVLAFLDCILSIAKALDNIISRKA